MLFLVGSSFLSVLLKEQSFKLLLTLDGIEQVRTRIPNPLIVESFNSGRLRRASLPYALRNYAA